MRHLMSSSFFGLMLCVALLAPNATHGSIDLCTVVGGGVVPVTSPSVGFLAEANASVWSANF